MQSSGAMWKLEVCVLCLIFCSRAWSWSFWDTAEEVEPEEQGVKIEVLFKPEQCEPKSKRGDLMNVHYDGFLAEDGSQFYCSRSDRTGHPQWFVLGIGQIIKGLDIGMADMCPGEKRKITVPPALAFGENGKALWPTELRPEPRPDPVPPNATVVFEVEVFTVSRGPRSMEAFKEMDLNHDKSLTKDEIKEYLRQEYEKKEGKQRDEAYYQKVMDDIFRKNDQDKDGSISAKEFNIYGHDEL